MFTFVNAYLREFGAPLLDQEGQQLQPAPQARSRGGLGSRLGKPEPSIDMGPSLMTRTLA